MINISFNKISGQIVLEKRSPDDCFIPHGRSVNLALTKAYRLFDLIGCTAQVKEIIVPMKGRMIHDRTDGRMAPAIQYYGKKDQTLDSVNRSVLNKLLHDLANRNSNVEFRFNLGCEEVDTANKRLILTDGSTLALSDYDLVIAADGVGSAIRESLIRQGMIVGARKFLSYAYKEIEFLATDGKYSIPENYLHIWPKGTCMLIGLPNPDCTFTGGIFASIVGKDSFTDIDVSVGAFEFFSKNFKTALNIVPDLLEQYNSKQYSRLSEVRCDNWSWGNMVLVGDAAHAVTPFLGQGMNFGMILLIRLCNLLATHPVEKALAEYQGFKAEADLLAQWSLDNFYEMSGTNNPKLQLRKEIETYLEEKFPGQFFGHHSMICFEDMSYLDIAVEDERQDEEFEQLYAIPNLAQDWQKPDLLKKVIGSMLK